MVGGGRLRFFCKCLMASVLCLVVASASGQMSSRERAARFKASHAFVSPLHLPPLLSGNFGELRGNHFHTGIDWKTEGREGFPVLAATDGVVSRVKMSPWGYGNALYLEGPDGVTTVYAHLQSFAEDVQRGPWPGPTRGEPWGWMRSRWPPIRCRFMRETPLGGAGIQEEVEGLTCILRSGTQARSAR